MYPGVTKEPMTSSLDETMEYLATELEITNPDTSTELMTESVKELMKEQSTNIRLLKQDVRNIHRSNHIMYEYERKKSVDRCVWFILVIYVVVGLAASIDMIVAAVVGCDWALWSGFGVLVAHMIMSSFVAGWCLGGRYVLRNYGISVEFRKLIPCIDGSCRRRHRMDVEQDED